ncbi:MAG TPA: serine hydrolase [Steroidobacter sp.]
MHASTRDGSNHPSLKRKLVSAAGASVLLLALAACGGGGGGGGGPAEPAEPPPSQPPPPPPGNEPPTAEAGEDQTIEFPATATLEGSGTDPEGSTLTFAWTGPSGVTFSAADAATTEVSFPEPGTYTLTLTVSDGENSASDDVVITVNPAHFPAADDDSQPDHGWTRVAAADVGMDPALLEQASTYARSGAAGEGSGMIVRHGRIVHSWGDIDIRYDLKSTTKSMGGIALGLAIDEGRLTLTDRADTHLPTIGTPPAENEATGWLSQITILHLATHTAGFDKPGDYQELLFEPGTTWFYSDSGLNWLADLLTNVYGQDLSTLLSQRVWNTLGVTADDIVWRSMANGLRPDPRPSGIEHRELASGIIANVNAMARVGLLFLRRGVWDGQRVLSEEFIDMVRTPRPEIANAANPNEVDFPGATSDYGVLWWTNASGQMPAVPRDTFWAWGLGESLIVVIPSLDLVIARAGPQVTTPSPGERVWNDAEWNGNYSVLQPFLDPIVQSVAP